MSNGHDIDFKGFTPYVYCDDAGALADWLVRVFGFVEVGRHLDAHGAVQNVELRAGPHEVWLDGYPGHGKNSGPPAWIGLWVDSVDAMSSRVRAAGVDAPAPENRPWGVRELSVTDPQGTTWGFIKKL